MGTQPSLNGPRPLAGSFIDCQNYGSFHLHSALACWRRLVCSATLGWSYNGMLMPSLLYCTKSKLEKDASSMGSCLAKGLASGRNLNSLISITLTKCLCLGKT